MTATLSQQVTRVGSTKPRIYTPPLPEHLDALGWMARDWSWGYDCIDFLEQCVGWSLLPWQRWLYIHALEKGADGTGFRFKFLLVLVARQNGKSQWLKGLGLWRLFADERGEIHEGCPGAKGALLACQNLQYAERMLKEVALEIKNNPRLRPEMTRHRTVNGQNRIDLTNERYWHAAAASHRGGRSMSVDIVMLDELREHKTWDAWQAIVPTTTVRPYSQIICCSNAGDTYSEVLRTQRDAALRRITTGETEFTDIGMWEWSVPMEVDPADESYWYQANPAMGLLNSFRLEDLRGYLEAQQYRNMPGFQTEHLALDVETPVLTTDGWKTMATVVVGDQVYHPDGHPVDVVRTTRVFDERDCFEVTTTDGRSVVVDGDHRWTVNDRRSNRGWETLSTRHLLSNGLLRNPISGGRYAYRLPTQRAIVSKPVDLPVDPYLLGVWLGDGTAGKAEITCIETEADELIDLLGVGITSIRQVGNARRINFRITARKSRDGFPARCRELGIWTDKRIPDVYLTAGSEQRLALLQGLLDTDGSIDVNGRVRFCSTLKEMAEQVLYLARSLGWRATMVEGVSRYAERIYGASYCVGWTHDATEPPPFRLRRKLARVQTRPSRAGERTSISIRSIAAVSRRATRCITVGSPDSLFLAGRDLIPTANCQWVDSLEPGIIPAEHWAETMDGASRRAAGAPVYMGVDVNYLRARSYVAVCSERGDGSQHVEVIAGALGTDWVIDWLVTRADQYAGIAVQKTGAPVSGMIPDMLAARLPITPVNTGVELQSACGLLYDGICEHRIFHRPAPLLDQAAASGVGRNAGDAWIFDRRNSPVDVAPLVAVSLAVWLANYTPDVKNPVCHPWPDQEVIASWEQPPVRLDDELERAWMRM